jgi:hypothetical protein
MQRGDNLKKIFTLFPIIAISRELQEQECACKGEIIYKKNYLIPNMCYI